MTMSLDALLNRLESAVSGVTDVRTGTSLDNVCNGRVDRGVAGVTRGEACVTAEAIRRCRCVTLKSLSCQGGTSVTDETGCADLSELVALVARIATDYGCSASEVGQMYEAALRDLADALICFRLLSAKREN